MAGVEGGRSVNVKRALRLLGQRGPRVFITPGQKMYPVPNQTGWIRLPPGFHYQAVRNGNELANLPGRGGTGMQPIRVTPVGRYRRRVTQIPLTGGQGQAVISASGAATVTVGPQGLGNIWYPAQVTLSTTTGPLDTSTCKVYLGAQGVPITLLGTIYTGNGTLAAAVPPMQPGQFIIAVWSGGHNGDVAAVNIIGLMDALSE